MSILTDRYVSAVVRLLPESQRPSVAREIEELIGDVTDGHQSDTTDREAAERATLVELGDPSLLAARYVDKPRALVGQELFPEYLRTLKVVAGVVIPILAGLAVVGAIVDDDRSAVQRVGAPVWAAYQGAVQVAFWVTLVYAFAHRWKGARPWSPDDLPDVEPSISFTRAGRAINVSDVVFGIAVTVLAGVLLIWQEVAPFVHDGGVGIPALHPDIWNGAAQAWLVTLVASLLVQVTVLSRRRWTYALGGVNAVVNAVSLGILAWLAFDDRLINPELLTYIGDRADLDSTPSVSPWIPVLLIGAVELWDAVLAFRYAAFSHGIGNEASARAQPHRPAPVPGASRP